MTLFSGSAKQTTYSQAQIDALIPSEHVGRVYTLSDTNDLVYSDGTRWLRAKPVNDLLTNDPGRPLAAAQAIGLSSRRTALDTLYTTLRPKLSFSSREAFIALLQSDAQLGAHIAAQLSGVRFDRYYANGPDIGLSYRVTTSNPTTDPTAITLVTGSAWLTQRFADWGAHADQFGFLYNGTNEQARWTSAIARVAGLVIPSEKYISTSAALTLPNGKFVVVEGASGGFRAIGPIAGAASAACVLNVGSGCFVQNVVINGNEQFAGGFNLQSVSNTRLINCSVLNGTFNGNIAQSGFGFLIDSCSNVVLERPRAYRVGTGISIASSSFVTVSRPDIERADNGIIGTDCTNVTVSGGSIRDCASYGSQWVGTCISCRYLGTTISRCNLGEGRMNSTVSGAAARHATWTRCNFARETQYTSLSGINTIVSTSGGAVIFSGSNGGYFSGRGCGVYYSNLRCRTGSFFKHLDTTNYNASADREFTFLGCAVRMDSSAAIFTIDTRAHTIAMLFNSFSLSTAPTATSTWTNVVAGFFENNLFETTANASVNLFSFTNTGFGRTLIRQNHFNSGASSSPVRLQSFSTHNFIISQNDFVKSFQTVKGGLDVSNNIAPLYLDQTFRVTMSKSTAGTTEAFTFTNTSDFTRMFTASSEGSTVGGPALGMIGIARVHWSMLVSTTNHANLYDFTLGAGYSSGSMVVDSRNGQGSGSGIVSSTSTYLTATSAGTVSFIKPSGASATIWATIDAMNGKSYL